MANTYCKNPNKKAVKEKNSLKRVRVDFNTGTITHKDKKHYNKKEERRKRYNEYCY